MGREPGAEGKTRLEGRPLTEIPLKEEGNLNKSSDEDEEMYSRDEVKYKVNYIQFLSNKTVTEKQM